jgi:hypothetical protein
MVSLLRTLAVGLLSIFALAPALAQTAAPAAPASDSGSQAAAEMPAAQKRALYVSAYFADGGTPVKSGLRWRVFRAKNDQSGTMPVVAESQSAAPSFLLDPGVYVVHCAYGLAAATRRVEIEKTMAVEKLVLNAGGLKIAGAIGDQSLPAAMLTARISAILPSGERRVIADNVPADTVIRLPEGRYLVESNYGTSNAVVSAEIAIKAGQLTEALFHHNAATLTLKLVNQPGGEALADTAWSVLTPGGDVIRESIGAFPSMILAEGNYTVVARHDGRVYTREFDVKSGFDQDVEVIAK